MIALFALSESSVSAVSINQKEASLNLVDIEKAKKVKAKKVSKKEQ